MTVESIKAYLLDNFIGFEGIETVVVDTSDKVNEAFLNNVDYPLLWFMFPPQRRRVYRGDIRVWKWTFDMYVLKNANPDDEPLIEANYTACSVLAEKVLEKLELDAYESHDFDFDEVDNTEEWLPKSQYGGDNCNGWMIPLSIFTD
jgi:hypothetical protein